MEENSFFVHHSSFVDQPCKIGEGTKIWHFSHIMHDSEIGKKCNIGQNVVVSPQVKIGDNVKIQNNVSIYTGVTCENDVFIGPSVVFTNVINPRSAIERKNEYKNTIIKNGASIGANATILCGITIGEFAFIGAGSVVTKNVNPFSLVVGNPAKQTGWMSKNGYKLTFDSQNKAVCPESKKVYELQNGVVIEI